jgi:hypothetical protein
MGERASFQFEKDGDKSVIFYDHWGNMDLIENVRAFVNELNRISPYHEDNSGPLDRREPGIMMVNFVVSYVGQGLHKSSYDLLDSNTKMEGNDHGHHVVDTITGETIRYND